MFKLNKNKFFWITAVFFVVLSFFLSLGKTTAFADEQHFLGNIEAGKVSSLEKKGYELENVGLKSSPDLYLVKRKKISILDYVLEPLRIKDKRERKSYKVSTNDFYFASQWNIPKVRADAAWSEGATGSASTVVAVLDTGMCNPASGGTCPIHEDLAGRNWQNTGETNCSDDIDNDGNTYVDDCYGWDFVNSDKNPAPDNGGSADGDYAHGTLVAGVIAASANNGMGIAGIDWNAKIMPVRVMNNNGEGWTDDIARGIEYAADNGAKVINMSFGYANSLGPDFTLENAVNYAYNTKGRVLVAASGNDNSGVNYPAAFENVLAVGATDSNDNRAYFSSYGNQLDIVAPGVYIPTTTTTWSGGAYTTTQYSAATGTSLSTPQISGQLSLLAARFPSSTNKELIDYAVSSAEKLSIEDQNYSTQLGFGRQDIRRSLNFETSFNPDGTLIKSPDSPNVYALEGGQKRWIGDPQYFRIRYNWSRLLVSSEGRIDRYASNSDFHFPDGTIVKGADPQVYVLDSGQKRWITDPSIFSGLGYDWANLVITTNAEIAYYPSGSNMTLGSHPNGTLIKTADNPSVYILESGMKRRIGSPNVFNAQFFWRNVVTISSSEMSGYPTGSDMHFPNGTLIKGSAPEVYILDGGQKRWVGSPETFRFLNLKMSDLIVENDAELEYYPTGPGL